MDCLCAKGCTQINSYVGFVLFSWWRLWEVKFLAWCQISSKWWCQDLEQFFYCVLMSHGQGDTAGGRLSSHHTQYGGQESECRESQHSWQFLEQAGNPLFTELTPTSKKCSWGCSWISWIILVSKGRNKDLSFSAMNIELSSTTGGMEGHYKSLQTYPIPPPLKQRQLSPPCTANMLWKWSPLGPTSRAVYEPLDKMLLSPPSPPCSLKSWLSWEMNSCYHVVGLDSNSPRGARYVLRNGGLLE